MLASPGFKSLDLEMEGKHSLKIWRKILRDEEHGLNKFALMSYFKAFEKVFEGVKKVNKSTEVIHAKLGQPIIVEESVLVIVSDNILQIQNKNMNKIFEL